VRVLDEVFGSTKTDKGYKILDSHVGLIYGDSITPKRANQILSNLAAMGYASCNCVFGIGSYTYNYSTRDSIGGAMKSTSGVVDGERRAIFKDPKTDNGLKKSAKGLLRVELQNGEYILLDEQTEAQEKQGELTVVFEDGKLVKDVTLAEIRSRLM
jgi:nicotinamide phosphoribosyltransferase